MKDRHALINLTICPLILPFRFVYWQHSRVVDSKGIFLTHTRARVHTHTHTHSHTHTHMHTRARARARSLTHAPPPTHTHISTYTCTGILKHTRARTCSKWQLTYACTETSNSAFGFTAMVFICMFVRLLCSVSI